MTSTIIAGVTWVLITVCGPTDNGNVRVELPETCHTVAFEAPPLQVLVPVAVETKQ
jgi:hypothetical protein